MAFATGAGFSPERAIFASKLGSVYPTGSTS